VPWHREWSHEFVMQESRSEICMHEWNGVWEIHGILLLPNSPTRLASFDSFSLSCLSRKGLDIRYHHIHFCSSHSLTLNQVLRVSVPS
jgi:hypothetical protein